MTNLTVAPKYKINMKVSVNNNQYEISSIKELQDLFISLDNVKYKEFRFEGYNGTSLLIVMNHKNSMCIYFTDMEGGNSYHICNPNGNPEKYETFIISNGQADEYEETMLINNQIAYNIMQFYFETGKRYEKVTWELD